MRNKFYVAIALILLSSVLFLGGCKKTASIDGHVAQVNTTYSNGNPSVLEIYNYDAQGRVTTYTRGGSTLNISYTPSSVIVAGTATTTYQLNNQGYAANNGTTVGSTSYSYDNNGYLITAVTSLTTTTSSTTNYQITNGNVTAITTDNTTTDSYNYSSKVDYRNYGLAFLGKNSADLANSDQTNNGLYTYNYTYDSKGRVQTQISIGNGVTSTSTYTYTTN